MQGTTSSVILDMDVANFHELVLGSTGTNTINVSNVEVGQRFMIRIKQHSSGGGTINWGFSTINWCDGVEPVIGSVSNYITLIGFVRVSDGTYDGVLIASDLH